MRAAPTVTWTSGCVRRQQKRCIAKGVAHDQRGTAGGGDIRLFAQRTARWAVVPGEVRDTSRSRTSDTARGNLLTLHRKQLCLLTTETGRLGTSNFSRCALQVSALGQLQNGDLTHHEMKRSRDDAPCRQLRVREAHSGAAVERNERVATGGQGVRWAIECGACAVWNSEGHSVAAK